MVVSRVVLKTKTPPILYIYIFFLWEIPWVPEVLLAFDATYIVHLVKGRLDFPQSRSLVFSFRYINTYINFIYPRIFSVAYIASISDPN